MLGAVCHERQPTKGWREDYVEMLEMFKHTLHCQGLLKSSWAPLQGKKEFKGQCSK